MTDDTYNNQSRRVTAISFDADGTLWDFDKAMRASLTHTLAELRRLIPGDTTAECTVDGQIALRDEVAREMNGQGSTMESIRLVAFARTLERIGHADDRLAEHLTAFYLTRRFGDIELYPDVLPTLDRLGSHYRLGLVSNGNTYPERCGLTGRFTFVVFAQDHGARKPSRAFYTAALREAGVTADALIHIGDSLANDVAGAQAIGVRAIWLNRNGRRNVTTVQPNAEITSLHDLPPALERL